MTFFRETDIDRQIARLGGVDVTIGSVTVKGLVDVIDESLLEDGSSDLQGQTVTVTVKTGSLPALAVDAAITADSVAYQVTRFKQIGDGATTEISVART